ncbi:MAG: hypothetical protein MJ168_06485 [Clostridia bacterium]|nr:hypothetical protein [Clostridia bacterium]
MAKKTAESPRTSPEDIQKRIEKYYKAQESEKKGKSLAASIIGTSILCFIILLIVILKMSGVGKTVVFTTDENGKPQTSIADTSDVKGTTLANYLGDKVMDDIKEDK